MPLSQAERLGEQRIAVWARDRRSLPWERQRNLFVRVIPIRERDEVLPTHGQHRPTEPLGAQQPAPLELADLRFPLPPQVFLALDRKAR
jgi:hypothetical protein